MGEDWALVVLVTWFHQVQEGAVLLAPDGRIHGFLFGRRQDATLAVLPAPMGEPVALAADTLAAHGYAEVRRHAWLGHQGTTLHEVRLTARGLRFVREVIGTLHQGFRHA